MITLEAADLIEGDASAASAVDYTINGVEEASSVVSVKALADGQLPSSKGTLYTCPASTTAIIKSIILVNTDSSARTVNLYTQRDGSNSRRIIPENLSLEANGGTAILADQLYVFSASGELLYKVTQDIHTLGGSAHSADTLANLNSKISDATLDDSSASRTPTAHKSSHATGGADELYLQDLEHTAADATLHDSLTSTPHVSAAEKTTWNGKIANVVEDTTPQLGGDLDAQTKRIYDVKVLDFKAPTELTIAAGAITVTQTFHTVDTEADAATDDLDTINGGSDGRLIVLKAVNDARTVVVKHNTGNIWLQGKADISLDDISDGLMLVYSATDSKWFDIAAGGGGGGASAWTGLTDTPGSITADKVVRGNSGGTALEFAETGKHTTMCWAFRNANQLNLPNNTWTKIQVNAEQYAPGNNFNTATYKFVAPVAGYYLLVGNVGFINLVADKRYMVGLYVNTTRVCWVAYHASYTGACYGNASTVVHLAAGDEVFLYGNPDAGVSTVDVFGHPNFPEITFLAVCLLVAD